MIDLHYLSGFSLYVSPLTFKAFHIQVKQNNAVIFFTLQCTYKEKYKQNKLFKIFLKLFHIQGLFGITFKLRVVNICIFPNIIVLSVIRNFGDIALLKNDLR